MPRIDATRLLLPAGLLFIPALAHANAGVPMIFLVMPAYGFSIVPIMIIEAGYLARKLELSSSQAASTAAISNIASTLIGVPLAWLILVVIQMATGGGSAYGMDTVLGKVLAVTWQAPWLIPYESSLDWMIPAAGLFLLLPFFFVSWWSEYLVTRKLLNESDTVIIKRAVRNANVLTYSLLACWPAGMLVIRNG